MVMSHGGAKHDFAYRPLNSPIDMRRELERLDIHDAFNGVLELIEKGETHKAHQALDQLINPRSVSRAAKLGTGPDVAEWADLVALALPYVETADCDPLYRDSARPRIQHLMKRMRKAIEATEATDVSGN